MWDNIKMDFLRAVKSSKFLLSILLIAGFMFLSASSDIYYGETSVYRVYITALPTVSMFLLMLSALPYSSSFCDDWEHQYLTSHITRTSYRKYAFSKCTVCFITATLSSIFGVLLFCIPLSFRFPLINSWDWVDMEGGPYFFLVEKGMDLPFILILIVLYGFYCGLFSVFGLLTSSYYPNKWLIVTVPYIWYYLIINLLDKINAPQFISVLALMKGEFYLMNAALSFIYSILFALIISGALALLFERKVRVRVGNA